jgi:hypothetical protein
MSLHRDRDTMSKPRLCKRLSFLSVIEDNGTYQSSRLFVSSIASMIYHTTEQSRHHCNLTIQDFLHGYQDPPPRRTHA